MKAVGLAGFAHAHHAPSLLNSARYQYVQALKKTNAALESRSYLKKDSLLVSIMVLSIFETITGCKPKSLDDWAEHIRGATALLKLRGIEQLSTIRGRRMFVQVASSLIVNCMQQGRALPPFILEWTELARKSMNNKEPAFLTQEIMMKFTTFRASVRNGSLSGPEVILARALEIDGVITALFTSHVPSGWEYQTIYTTAKDDCIWNGCYHLYFDSWVSQIWNGRRTMRILLHEMIRDALLEGFSSRPPLFTGPKYTSQFQKSTDVLYEMQAEIFATVPQHLGYASSNANGIFDSSATGRGQSMIRLSGPYFLIWPLLLTGIMDVTTQEAKEFALRNLRKIGDEMGIQLAFLLAKVIETKAWERWEKPHRVF